ncbi:UDP-N-acetylmuramoyl-L-alanyl-D-glutamate--2,6-diaminopimelate ligase 1 [Clostridia bacterium]|nr:UDP-N-acetylmuramoyl-L-alanyl-D-glutamate--2,6-diaminopimelate ligase 1 [Clostridia bacterium]
MQLYDLIEGLEIRFVRGSENVPVSEIVYDSRKAGPETLFCALPGANDKSLDGHDFCGDAYERGCRLYLCRYEPEALAGKDDVMICLTENVRRALALLSARFFGYPARRLTFVALTGTKGKTTISYMLRSIFEDAGKKVGLIGSNGVMYPGPEKDFYKKLLNTTPESYVLHGFLRDMADAGVEYVFLEATSQGFLMHRTDGIVFDAALYTNISPDHISKTEHKDFEEYFACKKQIFPQTKICYVNASSELFDRIVAGVPPERIRTYGFAEKRQRDRSCVPDYAACDVRLAQHGTHMAVEFDCKAPDWELPMRVDIPGRFNAENALGAVCIADHFGIPKEAIQSGLAKTVVAGRMEYVDVPAPYTVLIDFAHNRLSMEGMMETAKSYGSKRILCVFGLEGDRAHIRRFDSGEILGRDADYTILSDASPRTDDPDQILADIATGIERAGGKGKYEILRSRYESIPKILDMAREGDIVLLVGKGNVLYEEVHGVNTPIDERQIVRDYFVRKNGGPANPERTRLGQGTAEPEQEIAAQNIAESKEKA